MKLKFLTIGLLILALFSFKQSSQKTHFRFALVMPLTFEIEEELKSKVETFENEMAERDSIIINESKEYTKKEKTELLVEAKKFKLKEAIYAYSIQAFDHFMHKKDAHVTVDLVTAKEYEDIGIKGLTDKKHKYDYIMHYEHLKFRKNEAGQAVLSSEIDVYCTYQKKNIVAEDYVGINTNPGGSFDCSEMGEVGCVLMSFIQKTVEDVTTAVFEEDQSHK